MDKERLFLPDEVVVDMDPNMTNRLQQHTVVLDEGAQPGTSYSRVSPPKAVIDSSPLQSAMDKNKQSLIVKLSMRRPYDQLVQQGIMPSLKTSPAIYEQRRQLERAKTGDLLKAKIKKRPDRLELEQRHILEQCDSHVDPSLAEKRRMLEKALLVDHLNSKISHRPGPLDLIGKNILHVEEPIERMVKEGLVDYASTLDESNASVATPTTVGEGEDSLSSEGESLHSVTVAVVNQPGVPATTILQHQIQLQPFPAATPTAATSLQSQPQTLLTAQPEFFTLKPTIPIVVNDGTVLAAIATPTVMAATTAVATIAAVTSSGNIATIAEIPMEQGGGGGAVAATTSSSSSSSTIITSSSNTPSITTSTLRPILPTPSANNNLSGDLATVRPTLTMTPIPSDLKLISSSSSSSNGSGIAGSNGGKEKLAKKKSKTKSITKAKPIKFHEYKGPPNAHRGSSSSSSSSAGHGGGGSGGGGSDNNYQLIMQQQYLLEYLEEMCKKPAGVSSPSSSREAPTTTNTDAEELAGSDQTPIDSPLGPGGSSSGVGGGAGSGSGPGRSKNSTTGGGGTGSGSSVGMGTSTTLPTTFAAMDIALDTLNRLKVSQLKKYCKQYNLAVSGTKSNLIERLKPYIKSIEPCAGGVPSTVGGATAGGTAEAEIEDSLLAEQQKRIAELQLQLKKSQEELEQFRSLCNNPFAASDQPMVINAAVTIPPPPPPPPSSSSSSSTQQPQLASVLVGSPYSITTGGGGDSCDAPCTADGDASAGGTVSANQTPDRVSVPDTTVGAALEGSFFLEGLTPADSTTVDYGHDMHEMLPPELTSTLAPIERSPTHRPTLDKVLGQVQPTISGLTMKTEPTDELRNGGAGGGMSSVVGAAGGNGNAGGVRAAVGDMHDLSLSMKSVNFEAVNGDTGDASMQQDTIMLNDFEDIDLVDFHMHSLDSDGPFPMITNHDPDPAASRTAAHAPPAAATMHDAIDAMFCNGDGDPNGKLLATNSFATNQPTGSQQQQHVLHEHAPPHGFLNNNDLVSGNSLRIMLHMDLMDQNEQQANIATVTGTKQLPFGSLHHQQPQHHHLQHNNQQQQQQHHHTSHLHHSDRNNNSRYDANQTVSLGFGVQQDTQPVASTSASSSSSSTSSSPSNCFRLGLGTSLSSKHANKHHLNLHQQQQQHQHQQQQHQQQQQQQHHPHHHQQHHQSLLEQLTPPSAAAGSDGSNSTLIGDTIDSFQDNAMDFESLLTNDAADSVLNANNCHRMMLDCAQDKPMYSFLPDPSILDYFSDDCNGHDFEIKHLEY